MYRRNNLWYVDRSLFQLIVYALILSYLVGKYYMASGGAATIGGELKTVLLV